MVGKDKTSDGPQIESEPISADSPAAESIEAPRSVTETTCCIVGGGPAGVLLSFLLARKGVNVLLLESHKDFDRKFRGDTLHPSVLEVMDQLGLAERLHKLEHTRLYGPILQTADGPFMPFDLRRLKTKFPYIMLVPQVEFLNFLCDEAKKFPTFQLRMGANVQKLILVNGTVRGVAYRGEDGMHEVRADLTVGADGRFSRVRRTAGIEPRKTSPPMDVLWFNLPRPANAPQVDNLTARLGPGRALIIFNRRDHFQVGYVFAKGEYQRLKAGGIDALKRSVADLDPVLAPLVGQLGGWQDVTLLSVESSRCPTWYKDGVLLIGDSAHAMSPVGGVGINYAIHDAVEAANILTEPLLHSSLDVGHLRQVQGRRQWPTKVIQTVQRLIQKQVVLRVLRSAGPIHVPRWVRWILKIPLFQYVAARMIGFGVGRSRVKT